MVNTVDQKVVDRFVGPLRTILELELKAGNKIVETYESKESTFPMPNAMMIFLDRQFLTPIQRDLNNIAFSEMTDRHYWQGEYFDKERIQFLCCRFDPPEAAKK